MKRYGSIEEGRNAQWSSDPLPVNPEYSHRLPAPKPNRCFGYRPGCEFNWTVQEVEAIHHQSTMGNVFPFLALELISEATEGVLYAAENEGVGSGVRMVASLRCILNEASPS